MLRLRSSLGLITVALCGCTSSSSDNAGGLDTPAAAQTLAPPSNTSTPVPAPEDDFGGDGASNAQAPAATGTATAPAPPEKEVEDSFRVPVVSGKQIWAANPVSGRVALVDAVTHQIQTLPAGLSPTYLAALPGSSANRALVINQGSNNATLFRQDANSNLTELQIPLQDGATSWTIGNSGRWAIAWSDATQFDHLDATEGLQDVTLIDLSQDPPKPARFSVGYRPVKLQLDSDETRLYAVTHDGISVISLGDTPALLDDIAIAGAAESLSSSANSPVLDDVPMTPDGKFALVRFEGSAQLEVISLADRKSQTLTLPGAISDVDINSDGTRALAVLRENSQVAVFNPATVSADPSTLVLRSLNGETLGSAALPDSGDTALLFTNAVPSDRLGLLDLSSNTAPPRVVSLKAPIQAVFPTPDGSYAVALLDTASDSSRAGAFSVVPVADALPAKIQGTDAPPFAVSLAQTPAGLRGLVATRDDAKQIYAAYLVRMPSLQVDRIDLPSPPIAVGVLPEYGIGYVAESHPEGRITFIDLESGEPQTLTGFELADRVVGTANDGATP